MNPTGTASSRSVRSSRLRALALVGLLILGACARTPQTSQAPSPGGWHEFQGTWIAAGNRDDLRLGEDRLASIADLSGSLSLTGPSRPDVGFRAQALIFTDTQTGAIGRAVWTDERGDKVYSELQGTKTATGGKYAGTFVGGTGRYAGATGTYEFSWRFLIQTEGGAVQGQSDGLHGRIRMSSPLTSTKPRG